MLQKLRSVPKPGLRTIKTGIAVSICVTFYHLIGREGTLFALMAIVICMQDSVEKTVSEGVSRVIGTIIGATFGTIFLVLGVPNLPPALYFLLIGLTTITFIHLCYVQNLKKSITIGSFVFFVILYGASGEAPFIYSLNRTIDTLLGIFLAVAINSLLFKPKPVHPVKGRVFIKLDGSEPILLNDNLYALSRNRLTKTTADEYILEINKEVLEILEGAEPLEDLDDLDDKGALNEL